MRQLLLTPTPVYVFVFKIGAIVISDFNCRLITRYAIRES